MEEISVEQAAALLGRSSRTVRKLAADGELVARRLNGDSGPWLIDAVSVQAWSIAPPARGRKPDIAPSPTALAKRKSRARQKEEVEV